MRFWVFEKITMLKSEAPSNKAYFIIDAVWNFVRVNSYQLTILRAITKEVKGAKFA